MTGQDEVDAFKSPHAHIPSAVFGLLGGLAMAVVLFGMSLYAGATFHTAVIIAAASGVVFAIGFSIFAAWSKRHAREQGVTFDQRVGVAVQTGRVPRDAQPDLWLGKLEQSRLWWKRLTISSLVMYPAFVLLGIVTLIDKGSDWRIWAQVSFFTAMIVLSVVQGRYRLRRIRAAREELEGRRVGL